MNGRLLSGLRTVVFLVFGVVVVVLLSALLTPSFGADAKYSVQGAYEQPRDTVQVATFGTSTLRKGFSPDYFYERYGVVCYDSCTNAQPAVSSYYLLKDLLEMQRASLKVVMLDAGTLVKRDEKTFGAERVAGTMRPSLNKVGYLQAISEEFEELDLTEQLIPAMRYHTRWEEIAGNGFSSEVADAYQHCFHGQNIYDSILKSNLTESTTEKNTSKTNLKITEEREKSEEELESKWFDANRRYIDKIVDLCNENGLQLLLVKVPACNWSNTKHDSVSLYAERRGLDFIDLSVPSAWEECGLSYETDFSDSRHVNLGGSLKVTDYLGAYLVERYGLQPADDGVSAFAEDDLALFDALVEDDKMKSCHTLAQYLDLVDRDRHTVFIAVKGESAEALGAEERSKLEEMGLAKLAALEPNESYVGIYDGGKCVAEEVAPDGAEALITGTYARGKLALGAPSAVGGSPQGSELMLASGGSSEGDRALIIAKGDNLSEKQRGINFAVFNKDMDLLVDTASFNTHVGSLRTSDLPEESEA